MSGPDATPDDVLGTATVVGTPPPGLLDAFAAYERALMADDVAAMDALFAPGDATLRGDAAGLLVGHAEIHAFRTARRGAPRRTLVEVRVETVAADDVALVVAVTAPSRGGRGLQTQLWRRSDAGWQVAAAHVALPPVGFDPRTWRVVGDPLVPATARGPLDGVGLAVKDLFAVAGQRVGAGVPAFLDASPPAPAHAAAVGRLLDAGATVRGIARTDQLAYSIAGANPHHGTPVNAVVAGGLPGGSSSGSATAVALGEAELGLGTDTAGSIRVPASYQGLWGLRTTHGSVPVDGLVPLAPDFDTVGLLAREPALLATAAAVLLGSPDGHREADAVGGAPLVAAPRLLALLDPPVRDAVERWVEATGELVREIEVPDPDAMLEAFRVHQAFQAWEQHGRFLTEHPGAVVGDVAQRFAVAARVTVAEDAAARAALADLRGQLDRALGHALLVLPSAASAAPRTWDPPERLDAVRAATLRLTCVAGITGRPAVSAPVLDVAGDPLGLCLVGPRGGDVALVARAARYAG